MSRKIKHLGGSLRFYSKNSFSDVRATFLPGIFVRKEMGCAEDNNGILGSYRPIAQLES